MNEHVWINPDGTRSPLVKATAVAALPETASEPPSQAFLQALVAAEQARLRHEGWQACVDYIQHEFINRSAVDGVVLSAEDLYWTRRNSPYRATDSDSDAVANHAVATSSEQASPGLAGEDGLGDAASRAEKGGGRADE